MDKEIKERIIVEVEYEILYTGGARKHAIDAALDGANDLQGASLDGAYSAKQLGIKLKETQE